jgi:hypothetical protein
VFLVWWHFDRDFPFHIVFGTYSSLANLAISGLGILGWITFYAGVVGLFLLCLSGVRRLMTLRRESV